MATQRQIEANQKTPSGVPGHRRLGVCGAVKTPSSTAWPPNLPARGRLARVPRTPRQMGRQLPARRRGRRLGAGPRRRRLAPDRELRAGLRRGRRGLSQRARLAWDQDRAVEAAAIAARLSIDPVLASRQLETYPRRRRAPARLLERPRRGPPVSGGVVGIPCLTCPRPAGGPPRTAVGPDPDRRPRGVGPPGLPRGPGPRRGRPAGGDPRRGHGRTRRDRAEAGDDRRLGPALEARAIDPPLRARRLAALPRVDQGGPGPRRSRSPRLPPKCLPRPPRCLRSPAQPAPPPEPEPEPVSEGRTIGRMMAEAKAYLASIGHPLATSDLPDEVWIEELERHCDTWARNWPPRPERTQFSGSTPNRAQTVATERTRFVGSARGPPSRSSRPPKRRRPRASRGVRPSQHPLGFVLGKESPTPGDSSPAFEEASEARRRGVGTL